MTKNDTNTYVIKSLALEDLNQAIECAEDEMKIVFQDKNGNIHELDRDVFVQFYRNRIVLFEISDKMDA